MSDTSDSSAEITDVTSYDTGYSESYEVTSVGDPGAETPAFDPGVPVEETGSTSYDSTDWSAVAEASEASMDAYNATSDVANDLYQAGVDAYLAGDDMAAYELNQASIETQGVADGHWQDSDDVWQSNETTTITSYETTDGYNDGYTDDAYAHDTTGYDGGYSDASTDAGYDAGYTDTSSYETPVADGGYADASYTDTSVADTSYTDTSSMDTSTDTSDY